MSDSRCKCSTPISVLGDGCRYCQPQEHIDRLGDIISDMESEAEPTHYAVIADGHIIHAVTAHDIERGKDRCERFISSIRGSLPEAKDWTVKGVTVHKE